MNNNGVATAVLLVGGLALGYALLKPAQPPVPQYPVPPGQTYNGQGWQWTNTTGQPAWVTTTGIITNALGQILGSVSDIMANIPGNYQNSNPNDNPGMLGIRGWYGGGLI